VFVKLGDDVDRGQSLAAIDDLQERRAVKRREFELSRALLRLERASNDDDRRTPDSTEERLALLDVEQAEFELSVALAGLESTTVRAPVKGRVVHVGTRIGDSAAGSPGSGSFPFVIAQDETYLVEIEGDESEIRQAKLGASATVFLAAPDAEVILGTVDSKPVLRCLAG
jgi:multidrug resistance efflux pump